MYNYNYANDVKSFVCVTKKEMSMDILKQIKTWAGQLAEVGASLIALGIVIEVLLGNMAVPFVGSIDVIGNVQNILAGFSDAGLIGLVAIWVLYNLMNAK